MLVRCVADTVIPQAESKGYTVLNGVWKKRIKNNNMFNTDSLKNEGHRLLDEYKAIARINTDKAYESLKVRMKGKTWHFGQMHDKVTIKLAIGHLKKMIAAIKYKQSNDKIKMAHS